MAGLTDTGLTIKDIETLLSEIVAAELADIDAGLNTEADTLIGQLNAVYAAALLELWELLEEIYHSAYADTASGQSLSFIASITGTIRHVATRGTMTARFFGADTSDVPAGTEFYVSGRPSTSLFRTIADAVVSGTFVNVACEAVEPGSETYILNSEGEDLVMPNPPPSITSVESIAYPDSLLGADEESDADLRTRREAELGRPGSSTPEAIRADVLEVDGVDISQVYENVTMLTDANGLPPKSIEVLVYSETAPTYAAQDVVDAIWTAKPAGTETFGSLSGTATDSAGDTHTIYYSEPAVITTHMLVTLTYGTEYVGNQAVKDALVLWAAQSLSMGDDVIASDIVAEVSELAGVVSVDGANTGADDATVASGNPSLTISLRQVSSVADGDIDIVSTEA